MAASNPAERLAKHRAAMTLALAEGLSLKTATDRLARERWEKADAELRRRRSAQREASTRQMPEQWWQR